MSSNLVRRANGEIAPPAKARKLTHKDQREHGRSLTRLDHQTQLEARVVENQTELVRLRMKQLGRVGAYGMEIRATVTKVERAVVNLEPGAVNDVALISEQITLGLLQLTSDFVHEVTS